MRMRTTLILSFLAAIALTAGCGPTRDGVKSRADARGRLAAFNSQLNFDQATQAFEVGRFDVALRQINEAIRKAQQVSGE